MLKMVIEEKERALKRFEELKRSIESLSSGRSEEKTGIEQISSR